jgi:hypothetical protein
MIKLLIHYIPIFLGNDKKISLHKILHDLYYYLHRHLNFSIIHAEYKPGFLNNCPGKKIGRETQEFYCCIIT